MESCCAAAAQEMGASYDFQHELAYPSLSLDVDCPLVQLTKQAMEAEGVTPDLQVIGGGSDANIYNQKGIQAVVLGTGMTKVHTTSECIKISNLNDTARLALALLTM